MKNRHFKCKYIINDLMIYCKYEEKKINGVKASYCRCVVIAPDPWQNIFLKLTIAGTTLNLNPCKFNGVFCGLKPLLNKAISVLNKQKISYWTFEGLLFN